VSLFGAPFEMRGSVRDGAHQHVYTVHQVTECRHGGFLGVTSVHGTSDGSLGFDTFGIKVLKYDHSLLGGVYIDPPDVAGSSVFTAFDLQAAAVLFRPSSSAALCIGLGIGTVASALSRRHIVTDVIELHPEVYDAAVQHFDFSSNGHVHLRDALQVVPELLSTDRRYHVIVHDVFAGGGAPAALFSPHFFGQLKGLLHPGEAVLAVNYFGRLGPCLDHLVAVLLAQLGNVRVFVDEAAPADAEVQLDDEARNVVIFASTSDLAIECDGVDGIDGCTKPTYQRRGFNALLQARLLEEDEVLHSMLKTYWEISEYQGGTPVSRQPMDWQRGKAPSLSQFAEHPELCFDVSLRSEEAERHWYTQQKMFLASFWACQWL